MARSMKSLNLRGLFLRREIRLSSSVKRNLNTAEKPSPGREFKEVEIKVPWGKLSAKLWGPQNAEPIIALHGWQDNAGSFDPLMRDFPEDLSVLAVDFPGHGHSSWLPKGMMYTTYVYLQIIDRIRHHYGLKKIGLIAHSMGSMYTFNYTALFPGNVKFVVALDYYKYPTYNKDKFLPKFLKFWDKFFEIEQFDTPIPRHPEQIAIQRYIKATRDSIDEDMCRTLFIRGVTKYPDGTVAFTRDPRVQLFLVENGFSNEQLKDLAQRIRCPYAVLKSEESDYNEKKEFFFDVLKVLEECSIDFRYHTVPGSHHFHMKNTKRVLELTEPFIRKYL